MSFRKSRLSIALVWAMLPLTVLGSLPRMGCICADGQHKIFCERYRMNAADEGCVCCHGRPGKKNEVARKTDRGSAAGERACCKSKRPVHKTGELPTFCSGRPCRAVVDRPALITAVKVVLDLDQADQEPLLLALHPVSVDATSVSLEASHDNRPPPTDLITTLGVLLI